MKQVLARTAAALALAAIAYAVPAAAQYRNLVPNDAGRCRAGAGPAVNVHIIGINPGHGMLRVQLYRGVASDWLVKGHWLNRINLAANGSSATVCMPVPGPGMYGIAVRHDVNGNGDTDITTDGGGMSNNPSINILNLGKPSVEKTKFPVGNEVKSISIQMRYL